MGFREEPLAAAQYAAAAPASLAFAAERAATVEAQAASLVEAAEFAALVAVAAASLALVAEPVVMAAERAGIPAGPAPCGLAAAVSRALQDGPADGLPADQEQAGRARLWGWDALLVVPAAYELAARDWAVRLGLRAD